MAKLMFRRVGGGFLVISPTVVALLVNHRQLRSVDREGGGILLGRLIEASEDVVIDEVSPPGPGDKSGRVFFTRARKRAQDRVNEAWRESKQTRNYLGEWHTHPEDDPSPSAGDCAEWRRLLKEAKFEQDTLFFVIVGRKMTRAWECDRMTATISPLE